MRLWKDDFFPSPYPLTPNPYLFTFCYCAAGIIQRRGIGHEV